ncbi:fibronectin type III domain-containing protein [Streptomyces blattellae]
MLGVGGRTRPSAIATSKVPGSVVTPFGRHLAFGADPKTQMRISWQVPAAVRKPYVRIGTRPEEPIRRTEAEVRDLHTPELRGVRPAFEQYYVHVALDGLRPGTTYYYGVGHDGFDPASPDRRSTISSFRTAPAAPETFAFTAFGDQGAGAEVALSDNVVGAPAAGRAGSDACGGPCETDLPGDRQGPVKQEPVVVPRSGTDRNLQPSGWRGRQRGFSLLSVEAESGTAPRLKVSAPAQSGERIDHLEVRRGA